MAPKNSLMNTPTKTAQTTVLSRPIWASRRKNAML